MKNAWRALAAFFIASAALFIGDQILYRFWIIPRLDSWSSIPADAAVIVLLPIVLTVLVYGSLVRSAKHIFIFGIAIALSFQVHEYASALFGLPGHWKSFSLEDPKYFWTIGFTIFLIGSLLALSAVWLGSSVIRKVFLRPERPFPPAPNANSSIAKDTSTMSKRVVYHVLPDPEGWVVKKGNAKKASSARYVPSRYGYLFFFRAK